MPKTLEIELPSNEKAERAVLGLALNQPEHLLTLLAQESSPELFHDEPASGDLFGRLLHGRRGGADRPGHGEHRTG